MVDTQLRVPTHSWEVHHDLYARRVVGWSMADHLESRLVVAALALAVERCWPGEGLLAHSDGAASTPATITNASCPGTVSPAA